MMFKFFFLCVYFTYSHGAYFKGYNNLGNSCFSFCKDPSFSQTKIMHP